MPHLHSSLLLGLFVALFTGCATIVHGPRQDIRVVTDPPGATVYVGDEPVGATPAVVTLERNRRHIVRVEHPDYLPDTQLLTRSVSTWAIVGGLFTGPFLLIDGLTGSWYELKPGQIYFHLGVSASEAE